MVPLGDLLCYWHSDSANITLEHIGAGRNAFDYPEVLVFFFAMNTDVVKVHRRLLETICRGLRCFEEGN